MQRWPIGRLHTPSACYNIVLSACNMRIKMQGPAFKSIFTAKSAQIRAIHSKNSRVRFDPERVPWCQTHFGVRPDQKTRSDWPGIRVRKTFLTQISCQFDHRARTRRSSNFPPSKERRSLPPAACSWNKFHNTMERFEVRQAAFLSWRTLISIDINGITTIHTTHCHCILRWLHTWTIQKLNIQGFFYAWTGVGEGWGINWIIFCKP